ncbi:hypothetical protein Cgig2_012703 [Carnegiea gigantea]|uniref:Helicase-like transcription factor CHR28 n=1 Tax=Carnegiea gigantea TaxID=171969 RepID=A0A9Q1JWQ4_9CARY|nr:hypothetical protein Cgig2_012703 [Carnegiea gigantea]
MTMAAEEGFSLGSMNDFFDESDEGFDVSIDAESFFTILNEENDNSHPLPVGWSCSIPNMRFGMPDPMEVLGAPRLTESKGKDPNASGKVRQGEFVKRADSSDAPRWRFQGLVFPKVLIDPFYPSNENNQGDDSALRVGCEEKLPVQAVHNFIDLFRVDFADYGVVSENSGETTEAAEQHPCPSTAEKVLTEDNHASFDKNIFEPGIYHSPNFMEMNYYPSKQDWFNEFNVTAGFHQSLPLVENYDFTLINGAIVRDIKGDDADSWASHLWLDGKIAAEGQVVDSNVIGSDVPTFDLLNARDVHPVNAYDSCSGSTVSDEASTEPFFKKLTEKSIEKQAAEVNNVKNCELLKGLESKSFDGSKEAAFRGFSFGSGVGSSLAMTKGQRSIGAVGGPFYSHTAIDTKPANLRTLEEPVSFSKPVAKFSGWYSKNEEDYIIVQPMSLKDDPLRGIEEVTLASFPEHRNEDNGDEDDDDVCIIENMSQHGRIHPSASIGKYAVTPQGSAIGPQGSVVVTPFHPTNASAARLKPIDERLIFQALVQDLSQPKSEATPPDGVLAVPLLRHQRIALSWMVQKETNSLQCSGGILADDQGLGKTVSTIALILTERPASSRRSNVTKLAELETLDSDEDDDCQVRERKSVNNLGTSLSRGRPSAGTLIVCPTSVLRQWAEELHTKVTSEANLSVLVYHGSNRIKDPYEVAKYDVVLTTYSIVSMEVPKQPVVVKDGKDKRKSEADDVSMPSSKKRKHSSTSDKKRSKRVVDDALLESVCPLARVNWFRVVLDEAQSIKNYRTRVAQACWGLRAKRRWCLSGTPIQNAVDDLYSYFRFLKYDPYSVYNSFCSMVKFPISKNPSNGYRKLQAVLKAIMLRRTKATHLDGQPIITLPPKYVKLKKVEFSEEERYFYSRLEADSRAQFQAYADSGTVKQNYVNILLLLLRLRQACDHPLLVQGYDSDSVFKSSIHVAKKLPREQQSCLLNCLEASLAICRLCNDPPEDSVVAICGHVFCNQCISEHLTGDDNQCPAKSCKTQLGVSKIFSKATLKSCLDQSFQNYSDMCSASESSDQSELVEPQLTGRFDSSKIKAALEVLQSLAKPQVSSPDNVFMEPSVTDTDLLDKSNSTSSPAARNGLVGACPVVKEKAIVFSQWTRMLDLLETCLKESSIEYRRLDGTMSVAARDKAVRDFNTLPEVSVMIMSLKAASLGLNMVAACHVILLDLWWNPTTEDQAIDRAHRIGQTRPVTVVRLTVKDTVEDRILALQQRKRELVASAFGEDETGSRQTRLTVEDLKYLFRG